jgi:A/G-specific adenine glycosylase
MLQQTQVDRVIPRYEQWLQRFPTVQDLATASRPDVIREWAGLGYNNRAVRLHQMAEAVSVGGGFPQTPSELMTLPGVGRYTAAAIASFAFDYPVAVMDTNVRRVLGRIVDGDPAITPARAWQLADLYLPPGEARDWNQALMDLGATVCKPRDPRCPACPVATECAAVRRVASGIRQLAEPRASYAVRPFRTTARYFRGRILDLLRNCEGTLAIEDLRAGLPDRPEDHGHDLELLLERMERDGLIAVNGGRARLAG